MKKLAFVSIVFLMSCMPQIDPVNESEVIKTLEGFFTALDVENTNPSLIDKFVTQDFMIYEVGRSMNKKEFLEFVSEFPILESDWKLSDYIISTDVNSAHISLVNKGSFLIQTDTLRIQQQFTWLESAYLVKEEEQLKIRFYFSDNIAMQTDTIR